MRRDSSFVPLVIAGLALAFLVVASGAAVPSESPYTSIEDRPIKALSQEQIEGYETGQGMGFALSGELNGYPGPKHVLELRSEMELSEAQVQATERVFMEMKDAAEELGLQIVTEERELDHLFASHSIDPGSLVARVSRIAELQGQLRAVHLQAHLEMLDILNEDEIRKYIELRGYHGGEDQGHHPDGGHGEHN